MESLSDFFKNSPQYKNANSANLIFTYVIRKELYQ